MFPGSGSATLVPEILRQWARVWIPRYILGCPELRKELRIRNIADGDPDPDLDRENRLFLFSKL